MLKQKKTDDQIVICCEYKHQINNFGFTTQPTSGNYCQQREVYGRLNVLFDTYIIAFERTKFKREYYNTKKCEVIANVQLDSKQIQ